MTGIHRDFDHQDILYASWTDAIQEFVGNAALNLTLSCPNATTVRATPAGGADGMSVGVQGRFRYSDIDVDRTVSGSAEVKDVFVVAVTENDFVGAGNDPDETDYAFELRVVQTATTPAAVAAYRKLGEVDWDGSKIVGLRQLSGLGDSTAPIEPTAPRPDAHAVIAKGVSGQTEDILRVEDDAGTGLFTVGPDGVSAFDSPISAPGSMLTGDIKYSVRDDDHDRWLKLDGRELSQAEIETALSLDAGDALAFVTLLGTGTGSAYGTASTGKVKLPDMRRQLPMSAGPAGDGSGSFSERPLKGTGYNGGVETVTLTAAQSGIRTHNHNDGSLSADAHNHGAGTLAADAHTHSDGTLAVQSHTHSDGSLSVDNHLHAAGTLANGLHLHAHARGAFQDWAGGDTGDFTTGIFNSTNQSRWSILGSALWYSEGQTKNLLALNGNTNIAGGEAVTGSTANATAGVSGITGAAAPDVTGSTGSAGSTVSGSTANSTPSGVTGNTGNEQNVTTGGTNASSSHDNMPPFRVIGFAFIRV